MSKQLLPKKMPLDFRNVCVLLPDRDQLSLTVGVKATGQELFDQVCDVLKIKDPHFFGISVVKNNEYVFIDLEQKLCKYFVKEWKKEGSRGTEKFIPPLVAFFRVQYYVENGRVISDRVARHYYYCHLREQVLKSRCTNKEEIYFLLAAYGLQVDLGDYKDNVHGENYFEPQTYFPQWIIAKRGSDYILKHAPEMHREQKGLTTREAILKYVKESCLLEDVPVHFYRLHKWSKKKRYRESYISDTLEIDFDPSDKQSHNSGSSRGSESNNRLSRQSTDSHGSSHTSGIEADSRQHISMEMSVDEPFGMDPIHQKEQSCSSNISYSSSGIDSSSKDKAENDLPDDEVELAVDEPDTLPADECHFEEMFYEESVDSQAKDDIWCQDIDKHPLSAVHVTVIKVKGQSADSLNQIALPKAAMSPEQHSQSLDDVRLRKCLHPPLSTTLSSDTSHSYTFGCALDLEDKLANYGYVYSTADCKTKSALYGKRSMNCLSLDLLGEDPFPEEFVV
ncbi:FERM domain-containing protein 1 [Notechis scutatus]|uniref:FERM domain-containing protein 1 n=1 Tax=Notechis scutatus TaxID=8663 RepID=A0A6J1UL61_9SAUR|nr:FERM domain-containing protein 1 [Notechis scutatus]